MKLINLIVFLSLFTIFSATVQSDEVSEESEKQQTEAPTGIWKMINIIKKAFRGACTMSQLLSWVIA
uniref:Uncharacterized protein n=1 Tax=Trichobilharzia regenti TaxID=157069 RepID=A0AA85IVJ4_TRIRE|nr:unnamed protein product [Trichobilharzia regenti]